MSGHSKWAKIKRQKGVKDIKKGAVFTKLAKNIMLAAKEGGGDPDTNFSLRLAIDKAKQANMPSDNIQRAVKKATGEAGKEEIQKISYEAILGSIYLIIDCQTDNSNRTLSEIKKIIESSGAKLANVGSVSWQFQELGYLEVQASKIHKGEKYGEENKYVPVPADESELELIEIEGIEDIERGEEIDDQGRKYICFYITTNKNNLFKVHQAIDKLGYKIDAYELVKKAKDHVQAGNDVLEKVNMIVEALEEHEDVDAVWSNIN